jgi:hypothetical protein
MAILTGAIRAELGLAINGLKDKIIDRMEEKISDRGEVNNLSLGILEIPSDLVILHCNTTASI